MQEHSKQAGFSSKTATRTYLLYASDSIRNAPIVSIVADTERTMYKPNGVTAIVGGHWDGNPPDYGLVGS